MNDKIINGTIDEFGFVYINSIIINPKNNIAVEEVKSIIDTGASNSFINISLIDGLKLDAINSVEYRNPLQGTVKTEIYEIELILGKTKFQKFQVRKLNDQTYPCGLLIGMDIIKYCELNYSAKNKTFELELPKSFNK